MFPAIAEGKNFAIRPIEGGWLWCEAWQRPDLSRAEGAELAVHIASLMHRFAATYVGSLFDCRRATPIWGPATEEAIGRMLAPWEAQGKPVLVVPASEAIQQIALRRLIATWAPAHGRVIDDLDTALAEIERSLANRTDPTGNAPRDRRSTRPPAAGRRGLRK